MPPIHTNEVNRAVGAEISQAHKRRLQKFGELLGAHFTGSHRKFPVLHFATSSTARRRRYVYSEPSTTVIRKKKRYVYHEPSSSAQAASRRCRRQRRVEPHLRAH